MNDTPLNYQRIRIRVETTRPYIENQGLGGYPRAAFDVPGMVGRGTFAFGPRNT